MGFIMDILFGKSAKIFNKKGTVQHDLGKKKWVEWNNRLQESSDYDWRQHKGKGSSEDKKSKKSAN